MLGSAFAVVRGWLDLEHDLLMRDIRRSAPFARGVLLDVGCGDKPYEPLFRPYVARYVGVERRSTYESSANAVRSRADVVYDGDELPFQDGEFDTVLCTQVLEHVPKPDLFFGELARVLKAGGCLIVTVPFSYRVHSAPSDYHRFTRFALQELARCARLDIEVLEQRGGLWTVVGQKVSSHFVTRVARMRRPIQGLGGYGYEEAIAETPRWWTLPLVAPAIVGSTVVARWLDRIDPDPTDTLGYLMIARRRAEA